MYIVKSSLTALSLLKSVLSKFWRVMLCILTLNILISVIIALFPKLTSDIIKAVSAGHSGKTEIVRLLLVDILFLLCYVVYRLFLRYYRPFVSKYLMDVIASHTLRHDKKFFNENNPGEILDATSRVIESLPRVIEFVMINLASDLLVITVSIKLCFGVHWYAGMLVSLWVLLLLGCDVMFAQTGSKRAASYTKSVVDCFGHIADVLVNVGSVRDASAEEYESGLIDKKSGTACELQRKMETVFIICQLIRHSIFLVINFAMYVLLLNLLSKNMIVVSDIAQYSATSSLLISVLWSSARDISKSIEDWGSCNAAVSVMGGEVTWATGQPLPDKGGLISIKDLSFSYSGEMFFRNLNLEILTGDSVGIVGRSGSGKTTLLKLLNGDFDDGFTGEIRLNGKSLREMNIAEIKAHFAYVSQEITLFSHRTVRENITYGLTDYTEQDLEHAINCASATGFISCMEKGVETVLTKKDRLSGGQKQRIMLARAFMRCLCGKARILMLDEATSALDKENQDVVTKAVGLLRTLGVTVLVVAHRLETVQKLDRLVVLEGGLIVQQGTHEELRGKGVYGSLWTAQC